jgi:hypothetical protein
MYLKRSGTRLIDVHILLDDSDDFDDLLPTIISSAYRWHSFAIKSTNGIAFKKHSVLLRNLCVPHLQSIEMRSALAIYAKEWDCPPIFSGGCPSLRSVTGDPLSIYAYCHPLASVTSLKLVRARWILELEFHQLLAASPLLEHLAVYPRAIAFPDVPAATIIPSLRSLEIVGWYALWTTSGLFS